MRKTLLLLLAAAAAAAPGKTKVELKVRWTDKQGYGVSDGREERIETALNGGTATPIAEPLSLSSDEDYLDQALATKDGKLLGLVRTYTQFDSPLTRLPAENKPTEVVDASFKLIGKKLRLLVGPGGRLVVPKDTRRLLLGMPGTLDGPEARWESLLPGRTVEVGESWTVDGARAVRLLTSLGTARAECKLERLVTRDGDRVAEIAVRLTHSTRDYRRAYAGTMIFSSKLGRAVSIELKGRVTLESPALTLSGKAKITGKIAPEKPADR